jgi:hypothetical protein
MEFTTLTLDQARQLGSLLEQVNHHPTPSGKAGAFFFLMEIKQELMEEESYEELAGLKQLEEWHNVRIPFEKDGILVR